MKDGVAERTKLVICATQSLSLNERMMSLILVYLGRINTTFTQDYIYVSMLVFQTSLCGCQEPLDTWDLPRYTVCTAGHWLAYLALGIISNNLVPWDQDR